MSHDQKPSPETMRLLVPKHLLGSGPNSDRLDMSDYLVHLTSKEHIFKEILSTGILKRGKPFGFRSFRLQEIVRERHRSICFSEIPVDQLGRLHIKKGYYGIGFSKRVLKEKGAARVWYIEHNSLQARAIQDLAELASKQNDCSAPIWYLTPFVDPIIPGRFEWDHEREWRIQGDLTFTLDDIAFLIAPNSFTEFPAAVEIFYDYQDLELVTTAFSPLLEEALSEKIEDFFAEFCDPLHILPTDQGEYVWIVREWTTEEALEYLLPIINQTIFDKLASFLNSESTSWVRRKDTHE